MENVIFSQTFDSLMTIFSCVFELIGNCKVESARFHMIARGVEPVAVQLRLTFSHSSTLAREGC